VEWWDDSDGGNENGEMAYGNEANVKETDQDGAHRINFEVYSTNRVMHIEVST